jgi:hypothetical protein
LPLIILAALPLSAQSLQSAVTHAIGVEEPYGAPIVQFRYQPRLTHETDGLDRATDYLRSGDCPSCTNRNLVLIFVKLVSNWHALTTDIVYAVSDHRDCSA